MITKILNNKCRLQSLWAIDYSEILKNNSGSNVLDKVAEIAMASGRAPGDCIKCANDILKAFRQAGVEARKVELRSDWDLILHNSSDQPITQNGRHFAVESQGKIYDAFHPKGIAKEEYTKQFEVPFFARLELLEVE